MVSPRGMKVLLLLGTLVVVHGFSNSKEYLKLYQDYRHPKDVRRAYIINEDPRLVHEKFGFDSVPPFHLGMQRGPFDAYWDSYR